MHSRLQPLAPPQTAFANPLPRMTVPRVIWPSMPWMELGFFALLILGVGHISA